jgi:hypothetical protein
MNEQREPAREGDADFDPRLRTRNRAILVGLLVLSMLPLAGAIFFYYFQSESVTGAQTNRGALLQPPPQLADLGLSGDLGPVTVGDSRRWRVLVFPPVPCGEPCLEQLHLLRQTHRLLARDEDRVVRIAALGPSTPAAQRAALAELFPRMELATAPADLLAETLAAVELRGGEATVPADGEAATGVLVVDPLGNVVFFHDLGQIGEPLLSDLKRVLRLSNIG